ncbi:PepSY-associated TM helix domain-containing protein [Pseudoblastomonas halimionae]|uniref:PepSY domain-containing protein n=1 Tax=Alteriqipengyuania halimionae TaxID=1926630 RepID=A0A6I4TZP6_9SPHN|nr:PepSY domain-containing protein [Alteriqipengyuania halimionae]MXP09210.1 PepSY domain-containing protein [Alteriqipengyuania halimionae]
MSDATAATGNSTARQERWYRSVWRWHFYAGLLTVPFVLWLSVTGAIYLFKPQVESWIDRAYDSLEVTDAPLAPSALAERAEGAVPGSVLHRFILREEADDAQRIVVGVGADETRVYLHPDTGEVLKTVGEQDRFMRVIFRLHGELTMGRWGSTLVELAASWTIIMLLTGLFLWWPRDAKGLGGVLYPRLSRTGRNWWKDVHAVTGIWVALFAAVLIFTGLPWAKTWGNYFATMREVTGQVDGPVDWSRGSDVERQERAALDRQARAVMGEHAGHVGMGGMAGQPDAPSTPALQLDRVVPSATALALPAPVEITPPAESGAPWKVVSDTPNRPQRSTAEIDGETGSLVGRVDFAQRHWIDRVVGYGIGWHEGALFGLANQLFALAILIALVTLSLSGVVMWWRRRPEGRLGAPGPKGVLRHSWLLVGLTIVLAFVVPLFGISLALVVLADRVLLKSAPRARTVLGLR